MKTFKVVFYNLWRHEYGAERSFTLFRIDWGLKWTDEDDDGEVANFKDFGVVVFNFQLTFTWQVSA